MFNLERRADELLREYNVDWATGDPRAAMVHLAREALEAAAKECESHEPLREGERRSAAAEALARLEAWLTENRSELVCWKRVAADGFTAMFSARSDGEDGHGPTLLAALTAALDQAEAKP